MSKKKKKRHLKITGLIFLLLLIYLIGMLGYLFFKMPVKTISVEGNTLITENEIIDKIGITEKTPLFKVRKNSIKKKLNTFNLINTIEVKRSPFGNLKIIIKENKILYLNILDDKYILSNGKKIPNNNYLGYPILINYIPSEINNKFIKKFSKIDNDIIRMISEIEYSPNKYDETIIDDERFLLRMNDGNKIYINIANIEKLNNYQIILSSINDTGTLFLDSNSDNYIFNTKEDEIKEESKEDVENETELQ